MLVDARSGRFEVVSRGGNVAIEVFSTGDVAPLVAWLTPRLKPTGGRLDGHIQRAAVWTVPVAAGFEVLEALFKEACRGNRGATWYFSNVYDDVGRPLNWWK
jgi:hypothetical protein